MKEITTDGSTGVNLQEAQVAVIINRPDHTSQIMTMTYTEAQCLFARAGSHLWETDSVRQYARDANDLVTAAYREVSKK